MKIRKGDVVKIMVGKDAGKTGKIFKVFPPEEKILIEGFNLVKKHRRPRKQGEKGEIISVPRPLKAANVMLVCSSCGGPVRVGYKFESGSKLRICKKCKRQI